MNEPHTQTELSSWEFPGWGTSTKLTNVKTDSGKIKRLDQEKHLLGTWSATAICGNDITSSCLYVSALCASQAGVYAPLVLAMVAAILYLFRKIYGEVGSALPLNGGTYTLLLNTTNKKFAAAAACLTLLSYVATAVISAGEAMHYAHNLWHGLNIFTATIALLGLFAFLNILGISESAIVAIVIFVFHMVTLTVLSVTGIIHLITDPQLLFTNWHAPTTDGIIKSIFFGFAAAMLGISGFESSANFIEEQKPGVFPKTLKNMWVAVAIFNPLISLLSLSLLPLAEIQKVPPDLLAQMGDVTLGNFFRLWISIDAVLVLSGAVLTSYVGVTGLVRRMSLDRCLPQVLLKENAWKHTNHYIILGFFLVCCSILFVTKGNVTLLAGVYTLSFLSVMALFAIGNGLLKVRRAQLPREIYASWFSVIIALTAVVLGILGNIILDTHNLEIFEIYFVVTFSIIAITLIRTQILRGVLFLVQNFTSSIVDVSNSVGNYVRSQIEEINSLPVVYFTRGDSLSLLNKAALYVIENEQTKRMKVIHVYEKEEDIPHDLATHLSEVDKIYPQLRIDFVAVKGEFSPALIEALSERFKIPKNYMFIGTPGDHFPHRIQELGGVRLIL
ncbi:MAG: APC family permease [Bdellovibrionales bacterium]|nr:APC family permease [Bdellovibrionales bacterium]